MLIRHALHRCLHAPGFSAVVIATLALGIGTTTAVFTVVDAVLLKPLPFAQPDRIVVLGEITPSVETSFVSPITYDDWATRNEVFTHVAAFRYWDTINLEDGRGEPQPINLVTATPDYFDAIGLRPRIGRVYKPEQNPRGGGEAVLSHEFWMRRYQGDPRVLGTIVRIRGTPAVIVGIMPPMDADTSIGWGDVWTCLYRYNIQQQRATSYRARYLTVIGRLKAGVTLDQARERMITLQHRLWKEASSVAAGYDVRVQPLSDVLTGRVRAALIVLLVAVAGVLLAACANVANLMLARAADRHTETAVRVALGAGHRDLVHLILAETLILATAGGAAGVGLAFVALRLLQRLHPDIPRLAEAQLDPRAVSVAIVATLITMILSSLAPVLALRQTDLQTILRQGGRGTSAATPRLRRVLVAAQTALACWLLISGGLLLRSLQHLLRVDPGFRAEHALVFDLSLPNTRYPDEAHQTRFYRELMRRLDETPGVEAAGGLLYFPLKPKLWLSSVWIERDRRPESEEPVVYFNEVAGDYFAAMDIPLKAGRLPTPEEMWEARRVVLVNETMARELFPGRSPIGERMKASRDNAWVEVIGVVGDVRQKRLDQASAPEYYATFASMPMPFFSVVVRTTGEPASMVGVTRQVVHELDAGLAVSNLRPLSDYVASLVSDRRVAVTVLGLFAALTLMLGAVSVYGVSSQSVARRRKEIGVRLALGASPGEVRRQIIGESARLVAGGLVLGLGLSVVSTRLMRGLLFGVGSLDPLTYVVVMVLLTGVALVATWWPARRASRTDALIVMRQE